MVDEQPTAVNDLKQAAADNRWADVVGMADTLLATDKSHRTALRLRARALSALDRADEAIAAWEAVARVSTDLVEAPLNIARIEKRRSHWSAVVPACDRVFRLQSDHVEALRLAALAVERDVMVPGSELMWRSFARANISGFLATMLELDSQGRLPDEAIAIAVASEVRTDDYALRQERERLTRDLAERAKLLEERADYAGATAALRAAARIDINGGDVFRARLARTVKPLVLAGRDHLAAKNIPDAISEFVEALVYDPGNLAALTGLARCREHENDWQQAATLWAELTTLQSDNEQAWLRLGVCLERLGRHPEALAAFLHVAGEPYAEALARGRERLSHNAYKAARAHYTSGNFEQSAQALDVVLAIKPSDEAIASLSERVARALKRLQRAAFAERDHVRVVELGQRVSTIAVDDPEPVILKARALYALKSYDLSLDSWRAALQQSADRADVQLGFARAACEVGAIEECRTALVRALALAPGDEKCLELMARLDQKSTAVA